MGSPSRELAARAERALRKNANGRARLERIADAWMNLWDESSRREAEEAYRVVAESAGDLADVADDLFDTGLGVLTICGRRLTALEIDTWAAQLQVQAASIAGHTLDDVDEAVQLCEEAFESIEPYLTSDEPAAVHLSARVYNQLGYYLGRRNRGDDRARGIAMLKHAATLYAKTKQPDKVKGVRSVLDELERGDPKVPLAKRAGMINRRPISPFDEAGRNIVSAQMGSRQVLMETSPDGEWITINGKRLRRVPDA